MGPVPPARYHQRCPAFQLSALFPGHNSPGVAGGGAGHQLLDLRVGAPFLVPRASS